jgi:hypothetical protein
MPPGSAVRTLPRCRYIALILLALPAACAAPEPQSPFAGAWSGAERHQISFRDNTVVQQPAGAPATTLGPDTCSGRFRFTYARRNRDALIALAPEQPDLRSRLTLLLVRPDYPVAELGCGEGGTTYVLVDDRNLIAIHRDADVAGIEQLSRS